MMIEERQRGNGKNRIGGIEIEYKNIKMDRKELRVFIDEEQQRKEIKKGDSNIVEKWNDRKDEIEFEILRKNENELEKRIERSEDFDLIELKKKMKMKGERKEKKKDR